MCYRLIVHDTATYWTEFGQFVIISLIQVGGMGVVTVAVAVAMVSGKKIGLRERSTMQDAISAPKVGGSSVLQALSSRYVYR